MKLVANIVDFGEMVDIWNSRGMADTGDFGSGGEDLQSGIDALT